MRGFHDLLREKTGKHTGRKRSLPIGTALPNFFGKNCRSSTKRVFCLFKGKNWHHHDEDHKFQC
jgi:hypothetical protein